MGKRLSGVLAGVVATCDIDDKCFEAIEGILDPGCVKFF